MKKKMVIFTGVDATGKSTISNRIQKHLGWNLIHFDKVKSLKEGKKINYKFLEETTENILVDRYYIEEVVYASVYRNYTADYIKDLEEKLLDKFEVIIIYTTAKTEIIKERFKTRGEDTTKASDIDTLKEKYEEFLSNTLIEKIIKIDTTNGFNEECEKFLVEVLKNV